MELGGRPPGYRGVAVRCPGCADPMTTESVAQAEVDVCAACGGVWVDWFDGELRKVAAALVRGAGARASQPPTERRAPNEAVATGACPRCTRQLAAERHAVAGTSVDLLRCEDCVGVFVSRSSAEVLAMLPAEEDPRASRPPEPRSRLIAALKRILGLG